VHQHPYVGLSATRPGTPQNQNRTITGIVAHVGTFGNISEDSCVETYATILQDDGTHYEVALSEIVVDPAEAKRRLAAFSDTHIQPDGWEFYIDPTHGRGKHEWMQSSSVVDRYTDPALPYSTPIGPWEPLGNGEWRRPYRKTTTSNGSPS
jgi:hypothetical protein